jgi:hypothetical protein
MFECLNELIINLWENVYTLWSPGTIFALYLSSCPFPCHLPSHHCQLPHFTHTHTHTHTHTQREFSCVVSMHIYILQTQLAHLFQSSSLIPRALLMVVLASLTFLYSFLYINLIQVFVFLSFSYMSCA